MTKMEVASASHNSPPPPRTDEEGDAAAPLLPMRSNVAEARELLDVIHRVGARQALWKADLENFFRVEAEQDSATLRLTRAVLVEEALSLGNGAFVEWIATRESQGVGQERLAAWFHDPQLTALTPFIALVPCPRTLSAAGTAAVRDAVDKLRRDGLPPRFFVQTLPASAVGEWAPALLRRDQVNAEASYASQACSSGDDVAALLQLSLPPPQPQQPSLSEGEAVAAEEVVAPSQPPPPLLRRALDETPCLFLNDCELRPAAVVLCVVVGGLLIAAEAEAAAHININNSNSVQLASALQEFALALAAALPRRSFVAAVAVASLEEIKCDHVQLLNIAPLDAHAGGLRCFVAEELIAVAQYHTRRKRQAGDAINVAPIVRWVDAVSHASLAAAVHASESAVALLPPPLPLPLPPVPLLQSEPKAIVAATAAVPAAGYSAAAVACVAVASATLALGASLLARRGGGGK